MFDAICPTASRLHNVPSFLIRYLRYRVQYHVKTLAKMSARDKAKYLMDRARAMSRMVNSFSRKTSATDGKHDYRKNVADTTLAAVRAYRPRVYPGHIHHFMASELSLKNNFGRQKDWRKFVAGGLQIHIGPNGCVKDTMLLEPFAEFFAERLRECLDSNDPPD